MCPERKDIMKKMFAFVSTIVLVLVAIAPAMADEWNQEIIFSVNNPIDMPGRVLEPGKYIIQFADDAHRFVDLSTAAGEQIGFYQVIPISREVRKDQAQFVFARPKNSLPELKAFFYPDLKTGYEFAYPTAHVTRMAQVHSTNSSHGR